MRRTRGTRGTRRTPRRRLPSILPTGRPIPPRLWRRAAAGARPAGRSRGCRPGSAPSWSSPVSRGCPTGRSPRCWGSRRGRSRAGCSAPCAGSRRRRKRTLHRFHPERGDDESRDGDGTDAAPARRAAARPGARAAGPPGARARAGDSLGPLAADLERPGAPAPGSRPPRLHPAGRRADPRTVRGAAPSPWGEGRGEGDGIDLLEGGAGVGAGRGRRGPGGRRRSRGRRRRVDRRPDISGAGAGRADLRDGGGGWLPLRRRSRRKLLERPRRARRDAGRRRSGRRRVVRRWGLALALLLSLGVNVGILATLAVRHAAPPDRPRPEEPRPVPSDNTEEPLRVVHLADRLGLEGEQRRRFVRLQGRFFAETSRLRTEQAETFRELRRELTAPEPDRRRIEELTRA